MNALADVGIKAYETREAWLAGRAEVIGGSDVAALFVITDDDGKPRSANPYKSEYELWGEKIGALDPSKEETEAMWWGKVLEPAIAKRYMEETERRVNLLGFTMFRAAACPYLGTTPDAQIDAIDDRGPGILSIKNVDLFRYKKKRFDEELPEAFQIQLQAELAATGAAWGSFGLLVGGNRFHWQDVERNDAFIELMLERVREFERRVREMDAPDVDASERTSDALKRLYAGVTGETVKLGEEFVAVAAALARAKDDAKDAATRERAAKNLLLAAAGNASLIELPDGTRFKRSIVTKASYTVAAQSYPELRRMK